MNDSDKERIEKEAEKYALSIGQHEVNDGIVGAPFEDVVLNFMAGYSLAESELLTKQQTIDEQAKRIEALLENHGLTKAKIEVIAIQKELTLYKQIAGDLQHACEIVVNNYETDGMENMEIRDHVNYKYCKEVLEKLKSQVK